MSVAFFINLINYKKINTKRKILCYNTFIIARGENMTNLDLAIKFGGNEVVIFRKGYGVVAKCLTYIAVVENRKSFKVKAIGEQAFKMQNDNNVKVYQPIINSEVVDKKMAVALINELLSSILAEKFMLGKIRALVAVPSCVNYEQLINIEKVLNMCGVNKVEFVQNAVGVYSNLNIDSHEHIMVVDIGKHLTDIGVLNEYNFCFGRTYFLGGEECNKSIKTFISDNHNLNVDDIECENIKREIASLYENDKNKVDFVGQDDADKFVKDQIIADEVRLAITNVYEAIIKFVKDVVAMMPTDVAKEIYNNGVVFVGGGSSIPGLYEFAKKRLDFPVIVPESSQDATIIGVGKLLSGNRDFLKIKV